MPRGPDSSYRTWGGVGRVWTWQRLGILVPVKMALQPCPTDTLRSSSLGNCGTHSQVSVGFAVVLGRILGRCGEGPEPGKKGDLPTGHRGRQARRMDMRGIQGFVSGPFGHKGDGAMKREGWR